MRLCEGQQIMSSPLRHDPEGCEGRRTNSWNAAVSVAVWLTDMSTVPRRLISVVRPCWMMSVWWGKYSQSLMPPSVSDARSVPWRQAPSQGITWRYSYEGSALLHLSASRLCDWQHDGSLSRALQTMFPLPRAERGAKAEHLSCYQVNILLGVLLPKVAFEKWIPQF